MQRQTASLARWPQLTELFHRLMGLLACTSLSVCLCVRVPVGVTATCCCTAKHHTQRIQRGVKMEAAKPDIFFFQRTRLCPWHCGCPVAAAVPARVELQGGSPSGGSGPLAQSLPQRFTPLQYTSQKAARSLTS